MLRSCNRAIWATLFLLAITTPSFLAAQCVKFDGLPANTVWGGGAGHSAGDVVHTENDIEVSLHKFRLPPTGGTGAFGKANVDTNFFTSSPNSIHLNNIALGFDFTNLTALPTRVTLKFRSMGGADNLSINGTNVVPGPLSSGSMGPIVWAVMQQNTPQGREGSLVISGAPIHSIVVGGQELSIDTVCAELPQDEFQPDHFQFYSVERQNIGVRVAIGNQFHRGTISARLRSLEFFANPCRKNREQINHQNAHLAVYGIDQQDEEPSRVVTIENQFGRQQLRLTKPRFLAVPAEKKEDGSSFPRHLDHYKLYEAEGEAVGQEVEIEDQFRVTRVVRVQRPILFGVPARKDHDNANVQVQQPNHHLVIYTVDPPLMAKHNITIEDQFGKRELKTLRSLSLGVPSLKLFFDDE